jgi:transposase-like protein
MTKPIARDPIYSRRRFNTEIIELCVRWYVTYRLSYRDLVAMMAERGISVSHTTIHRWVIRYVPEFEKRWNRFARPVNNSWRVDETYIKVRASRIFSIGLSTSTARQWIFCFVRIAVSRLHKRSSVRHCQSIYRGGRAR